MHTLYIETNKGVSYYLINTSVSDDFAEKQINEILDRYPNCNWWLEDGYKIEKYDILQRLGIET